jgi:hypothetical protein
MLCVHEEHMQVKPGDAPLTDNYLRQRFAIWQRIAVAQSDGEVSGIGGANTLVSTNGGMTLVPNTVLLESVVQAVAPTRGDGTPEQA